jgi:DNA mismatch repair ATPase MutL
MQGDTRPQLEFKQKPNISTQRMTVEEYKKLSQTEKPVSQKTPLEEIYRLGETPKPKQQEFTAFYTGAQANAPRLSDFKKPLISDETVYINLGQKETPAVIQKEPIIKDFSEKKNNGILSQVLTDIEADETKFENATFIDESEIEFRYIGEAFRTYLIVQYKKSIWFIDKHAAHERMLYEELKQKGVTQVQALLSPVPVTLSREEHSAVLDNLELLSAAGFEIEEFGTASVLVRAVPASLVKTDVMFLVCDIAANLLKLGKAETDILDDLYHNIACRSAIKGGNLQSAAEMEEFARKIITNNDIMYCPHGRPVAFELKRSELEKQFGRTK